MRRENLLRVSLMAIGVIALVACDGAGGSASGHVVNGQSISGKTPTTRALFASDECVTGVLNATGTGWHLGGSTITLTNKCSDQDVDLNNSTISFTSINNDGGFASWDQAYVYVNDTNYTVKFEQGSGNTEIGTISADKSWTGKNDNGVIHAGQSIVFNSGVNTNNGGSYQLGLANSTFTVNGRAPVEQKGEMTVSIDTKNAVCIDKSCESIHVTLKNNTGDIASEFDVPNNSIGGIYNQKIESLAAGNYSLSASSVNNNTLTYSPNALPQVQANQNTNVSIIYKEQEQLGTANITLPVMVADYTGTLQVEVLNAKESNAVVNTFNVKQGATINLGNLAVSDTKHEYFVKVQGVANPKAGEFYVESGLPTVVIKNGETTDLNVQFKQSDVAKNQITYNINGLDSNDKASITFQDATQKYAYPNYSNIANGQATYYIEQNTNLGYSILASGRYIVNPIENTLVVTKNQTIDASFEKKNPTPSGQTVAGWPNYIAMGAVGGPNTDRVNQVTSGGDDSFGGKPVDVVFKYAGVNGNGDPGVIDPPMNALRMAKDLALVSEYNKHPSRVAIVEYTGEMSGGENYADFTNTKEPNPSKQDATYIMARHFASLAADAMALADRPVMYDGDAYYGSLIMNPDLLGAMQQNNYIDDVNHQLPKDAVNTAVDQTLCLLTTEREYYNTSTPNGDGNFIYKNKAYKGTPYKILTQMLDDGYPEWSISGMSDPFWNTAIDNNGSKIGEWLNECIQNPTYDTTKYAHPDFKTGFEGWVQANNWLIRAFAPKDTTKVTFGWQDNMWAIGSGFWVQNELTDEQINTTYSQPMIDWLKNNAPSTIDRSANDYAPDYFVFDRYETDDSSAPGQATLYSARSWDNYIIAIGKVSRAFDNMPLMMWQIPGSHIPYVGEESPEYFNNLPGQYIFSSAPVYFFGDKNLKPDLSNMVVGNGSTNANVDVGNFAMLSTYNCPISGCNYKDYLKYYKGKANNYDWSKDNGRLDFAAENNIFSILWGGGNTTNVIKNFSNPNDHGWLADKIKTYYQNPTYLKK